MSGVPAELIDNAIGDVAWVQGSREQAEAVLEGLGGTWDVEHTHAWPTSEDVAAECMDPCPLAFGAHVRRNRWRSDPLPPA